MSMFPTAAPLFFLPLTIFFRAIISSVKFLPRALNDLFNDNILRKIMGLRGMVVRWFFFSRLRIIIYECREIQFGQSGCRAFCAMLMMMMMMSSRLWHAISPVLLCDSTYFCDFFSGIL
jgi:hypothetical protein